MSHSYAKPAITSSPADRYSLTRDGVEVLQGTEHDVWGYIHSNHSYSVSHALRYEGYAIIPITIEDEEVTLS